MDLTKFGDRLWPIGERLLKGGALLPVVLAGLTPILLLALIVSGIAFGVVAWKPPTLWMDTFGGNSSMGDNAMVGVSSDSSGVYSAAYSNYSEGLPGGSLHLIRYDPAGGTVWTKTVGNSSAAITAISVGTDGIYLVGNGVNLPFGIGFVQKFDFTGNRLWTTNSSYGRMIFATASEVYVSGYSTLEKYDLAGKLVWSSQVFNATGGNDVLRGVYADTSGSYAVGDFAGNLTGQTPTGGKDVFLVKYDTSGGVIWVRQFGTAFDQVYSVSGDSAGVYVSGTSYFGPVPGFGWLRKYDLNGNLDWMVAMESPDGSGAGDSSVSSGGSGVYLSLSTVASRDYLMKFDTGSGQELWSFQMGTTASIYGVGYAYRLQAASNVLYVAGSFPENGHYPSIGFVSSVSTSPSLVLFGLNPPVSFIILGGLLGGSAVSILAFLKLRRKRDPARRGPSPATLPILD